MSVRAMSSRSISRAGCIWLTDRGRKLTDPWCYSPVIISQCGDCGMGRCRSLWIPCSPSGKFRRNGIGMTPAHHGQTSYVIVRRWIA